MKILLPIAFASIASCLSAVIVNPSFENPQSSLTTNGIPGWSWSSNSVTGVWRLPNGFFPAAAPDGSQIGYINGSALAQQTGYTLLAGTHEVSVFAGRRGDGFWASFDLELWAGGTVETGDVVGGTLLGYTSFDFNSAALNSFTPLSVAYVADPTDPLLGEALSVRFRRTEGRQINVDAVSYSFIPIPEPAVLSFAAVGLGVFALLFRRRC